MEVTVVKNVRDILGGILTMQDLEISDIMVHRTRMTMIDGDEDPKDIVAMVLKKLKTYDTDGKFSLDEFAVMHADHTRPMTVRAFQIHDANGDAQVTEAEMGAMAVMMQCHMSGQQGGMPNMGEGIMNDNGNVLCLRQLGPAQVGGSMPSQNGRKHDE